MTPGVVQAEETAHAKAWSQRPLCSRPRNNGHTAEGRRQGHEHLASHTDTSKALISGPCALHWLSLCPPPLIHHQHSGLEALRAPGLGSPSCLYPLLYTPLSQANPTPYFTSTQSSWAPGPFPPVCRPGGGPRPLTRQPPVLMAITTVTPYSARYCARPSVV